MRIHSQMNRGRAALSLALLAALGTAACGSDSTEPETNQNINGWDQTVGGEGTDGADSSDGASVDGTDGAAPVRLSYTDETLPKADLPAEAEWDTLKPPLAQTGKDTGEPGVMYSAALGGYFLMRVQLEDGSYNYEYDPDKAEWIWEDVIHRQVGPAYAMVLLYQATGRPEFLLSAEWGFAYAEPRIKEQADGTLRLTDIGATSIYLFGLTHHMMATGLDTYKDRIIGLADHLVSKQKEDGSLTEGSPLARGQVIQALSHAYLALKDEKYLDAFEKAAKYSCDNIDDISLDSLPYFALYGSEALADLHNARPADWIAPCAWVMADYNLNDQWTPEHTDKEHWWGGFWRGNDSAPTWSAALRLESLLDSYRLAQALGDTERETLLRERILMGVAFQQRMQWRIGETDEFPEPDVILGAYPYFMSDDLTRTDLAWHGTAMLIKAVKFMDLEDYPGKSAQ